MWILLGVLAGIILIKWMNRRERKKKLEQEQRTTTPQEAYRWMPPEKPTELLKRSESSSEASEVSEPQKPLK